MASTTDAQVGREKTEYLFAEGEPVNADRRPGPEMGEEADGVDEEGTTRLSTSGHSRMVQDVFGRLRKRGGNKLSNRRGNNTKSTLKRKREMRVKKPREARRAPQRGIQRKIGMED